MNYLAGDLAATAGRAATVPMNNMVIHTMEERPEATRGNK